MNRILRFALIAAGVCTFLVLAAVALAFWLVDVDAFVKQQLDAQLPAIEARLGRKVTAGEVRTRLFPRLGGAVEDLTIGSDPARSEDDRPLLSIGSVSFELDLWKAITTLGAAIEVQSIAVDGVKVSVVRYADGRLSYQDILDRQPPAEPAPEPAPTADEAPIPPKLQEILRGLRLDELRLADAELRLLDLAAGPKPVESFVRHLDVRARDVQLGKQVRVTVDAAILSEERNLHFGVGVGPVPETLENAGSPALADLELRLADVELGALLPYVQPLLPIRLGLSRASVDLAVPVVSTTGPMAITARIALKSLRLAGGRAFDFAFDTAVTVDAAKLSADVARAELALGEVALSMAGKLENLSSSPRFEKFTIRSSTLDPSLLLAYYPPARASLPPDARLDGPIVLDLVATGDAQRQTVRTKIDLAAVDVLYPGALEKPRGTPLSLVVDGGFTSSAAELQRLALTLDELALEVSGTIRDFADPTLDLRLSAPAFRFDRLARLAPGMAAKLAARGVEAKGSGALSGHVKGRPTSLDAALEAALTGLDLDVPGTTVKGDVTLKAHVTGDPAKAFEAGLRFDADGATIVVPETLNKAAAVPFHADVAVTRAGDRIELRRFDLKLAELAVDAKGTLDLAAGRTDVKVAVRRLDLEKFARTVPAVPLEYARRGFVETTVELDGDPNALETMQLRLPTLNARLGRSDVRGSVTISNLAAPAYAMELTSDLLDVDALYLDADSEPATVAEPTAAPTPPADRPERRKLKLTAKVEARRLVAYDYELHDFKGIVRIDDGRLTVDDGGFRLFGGTFDADGTELEYWRAKKPFRSRLTIRDVQVGPAVASVSKYGDAVSGKGDFTVALAGAGFGLADLEQALTGTIDVAMKEGRFAKTDLLKSITGRLAQVAKLPGVTLQPLGGTGAFRDLKGRLVVKDGRLALEQPVSFTLDGHALELGGAVGVAGTLGLQGTYALPGAVLQQATKGRCATEGTFPVPFTLTGPILEPKTEPDLTAILKSLAVACLKGGLGQQLSEAVGVDVGRAAQEAEAKARAEAARLEAEAGRLKTEAEAKARAEAERLQAEARAEAARVQAAAEAKARAEAERLKAEGAARARAEADRLKAEADRKRREAEAAAKKKAADFLGGFKR